MTNLFPAIVIDNVDGIAVSTYKHISLNDLPDLDVLVHVEYSSLNYKDGLAVCGNKNKVARKLPMVGGIDLAGTVVESRNPSWKAGDKVMVNGWSMSETQWGGFSQYQRVDSKWLLPIPAEFSTKEVMGIGTAGYTAALCVDALEQWGALNGDGEILVTGAAGGVGSIAIALLSALGKKVTASTGRAETHHYLTALGATEIINRAELSEKGAPLQKERWAAVVDSVGSTTLANALAQTIYGGAVSACGLAGGMDLPGTVLPHILRGVALLGIDSVMAPVEKRQKAWRRLARDFNPRILDDVTRVEPMSKVIELGNDIVTGKIQGRIIIDVDK